MIGDDVYIGNNACLKSEHGKIIIGNHVMLGPNVHIHGGNHKYDKIGVYMKENHRKSPDEDGIVKICDDVWIGSGSYILKGVTIGEGSVIGACTVVVKNVAPYSVVVGSLQRKVFQRFDAISLAQHKKSGFSG
jgi:acetyltransferase-like isoleucine patch superfamily enzyme